LLIEMLQRLRHNGSSLWFAEQTRAVSLIQPMLAFFLKFPHVLTRSLPIPRLRVKLQPGSAFVFPRRENIDRK
jgi:hypothetical protein